MKKTGFRLPFHAGFSRLRNDESGLSKSTEEKSMNFDPQIVAQANAFVNALRSGKRARVPALKMEYWQQFMTIVYAGLGLA